MANEPDFLEWLWTDVINLDPGGKWIKGCIIECSAPEHELFQGCSSALKKAAKDAAKAEDLGRVCRSIRYEACFGTLYSLSDPGLKSGRTAGLHGKLLSSNPGSGRKNAAEAEFFESLWEMISPDDDGKWLADLAGKKTGDGPFEDTGAAVKRLLASGMNAAELGGMAAWHRYDACRRTLQLLQEAGIKRTDEADGLYESLLGADPSGLEGRPGSWPLAEKQITPTKSGSPTVPIWKINSVQACAFSPDSRTLAVAGAGSPVRFFDLATGKERLSCEGVKVHIYRIAFSPDGKQVAAGKIHDEVTVCDAATGKLMHRFKRSQDEISGLVYAGNEQLVCSSWGSEIRVFDTKKGASVSSIVLKGDCMVNDIAFSAERNELVAHWQKIGANAAHATIWNWADRKERLDIRLPDSLAQRIAWMPRTSQFAVSDSDTGVRSFDAASGKMISKIGDEECSLLAFTPDGKQLITGGGDGRLRFWSLKENKQVFELKAEATEGAVSPDGKYLAVITSNKAMVWELKHK